MTVSMETQQNPNDCLIVELTGKLYGVDARLVREIVRLPEITPMEDAPPFILGVINLRGQVIPILDLNIRMGRVPQLTYELSDLVVVLEQSGHLIGVLINEVIEVLSLDTEDIDSVPSFEEFEPRRYRFIIGVAKVEKNMVMLLDPEHLLHVFPSEITEIEEELTTLPEVLTDRRRFNPQATEEDRKIFRKRAHRLMKKAASGAFEELRALVVVRMNSEMLSVDLVDVRGFASVRQVTPIPCCPRHIAGSMNLRGDILTLVDIRHVLGLSEQDDEVMEKVMVIRMGSYDVGVMVHEVVDVIHLHPDQMSTPPTAASALKKEHLQGAAPYEKKMLGVLNIQPILSSSALLVNEEV